MAEKSGFFNSYRGDRRYYVSFLAEYFASFVGNGVFWGGNFLKVEPYGGNMDVQMLEGKAWINGYYYNNADAPITITVPPSDLTMPRIDAIVLRLDLREESRAIYVANKQGVASATPTVPDLQRDEAIWELKLAEVRVNANVTQIYAANITDFRLNSDACGIVTNFVPNDFTYDSIFNQYQSQLELRMAEWDTTKEQQKTDWNNQMTQQSDDYQTFRDEFMAFWAGIKAGGANYFQINFDNPSIYPGCTRFKTQVDKLNILEEIRVGNNVPDGELVASRLTTKLVPNGSQADIEYKYYDMESRELIAHSIEHYVKIDNYNTRTYVEELMA